MSHRLVSDQKYRELLERDQRRGVEATPARMRWLRAQADDFAAEQEGPAIQNTGEFRAMDDEEED